MFTVSKKVSFSVVLALLAGWAVMSFLIFQSSQYLLAAEADDGYQPKLAKGVKLMLVVDKKAYQSDGAILIALRNDSRKQIWLATAAGGCPATWWYLEKLGNSADEWATVNRTKTGCTGESTGLEKFTTHSLKTEAWNGLVQTGAIGEIYEGLSLGTYRITVPYLVGQTVKEETWEIDPELLSSASFTVL